MKIVRVCYTTTAAFAPVKPEKHRWYRERAERA
ncbi:MAG: hypothetical protein JWN56_3072 [Sphingobacteriales bacterium]|nr:hypothetical protein [Sphingobacteriales bacterium]